MNLKTASYVLLQQAGELSNLAVQLQMLAGNATSMLDAENNSTAEIPPQVHAIAASMNIIMVSIGSSSVLVQQAIDKVSELSN